MLQILPDFAESRDETPDSPLPRSRMLVEMAKREKPIQVEQQ
jgi:hypothetical protein